MVRLGGDIDPWKRPGLVVLAGQRQARGMALPGKSTVASQNWSACNRFLFNWPPWLLDSGGACPDHLHRFHQVAKRRSNRSIALNSILPSLLGDCNIVKPIILSKSSDHMLRYPPKRCRIPGYQGCRQYRGICRCRCRSFSFRLPTSESSMLGTMWTVMVSLIRHGL